MQRYIPECGQQERIGFKFRLRGVNVTLRGICFERGVTFARKLSETALHAVPVSFTLHSFFIQSYAIIKLINLQLFI